MTSPSFPKIPRWDREVILTEKLDGTNGLVAVVPPDQSVDKTIAARRYRVLPDGTVVAAGSRKRWLNPNDDNFEFAQWVWDNAEELAELGPGKHYGEWYGKGIQRSYGLNERRFALFNVMRWHPDFATEETKKPPDVCEVVTVLARCQATDLGDVLPMHMATLEVSGSAHVPGFTKPEGIVLYHTAGNNLYKATFDGDNAKTDDGYVIQPVGAKKTIPVRSPQDEIREALQNFTNKDYQPQVPAMVAA